MKKIILIIFLLIPIGVSARSKTNCDYNLVSNLKKIAGNVDITYTYNIIDDSVYFDVTLVNIQPDMYFIYSGDKNTYFYSDTVNGEITLSNIFSGFSTFTFYSNRSDCMNEKLVVKNIKLPYYNRFYHYDECIGIENYRLCQKWLKYEDSYENFVYNVNEYKSSLNNQNDVENITGNKSFITKLIEFYVNYFYVLFPVSLGLIIGIYYLVKIIMNRKNRFDI